MDGLLSIGEEIQFSDEDEEQNKSANTIATTNNESALHVDDGTSSFTEKIMPWKSQKLYSFNSDINRQKDVFEDLANESDDFFSQIDIPLLGSKFDKTSNSSLQNKCRDIFRKSVCKNIINTVSHNEPTSSEVHNSDSYSIPFKKKFKLSNSVNVERNQDQNVLLSPTVSRLCSPFVENKVANASKDMYSFHTRKKVTDVNEKEKTVRKYSRKQRKFPGPAGVLPKINSMNDINLLKSPEHPGKQRCLTPCTPKTPLPPLLTSSQDDDFSRSAWQEVLFYTRNTFPQTSFVKISSVINKANKNELINGKVVLLCALIKSFSITGSCGRLLLKDPTGEIDGTVHKHVLEEFEPALKQGSGVILKDVSVFSPSPKKHYVNVTPVNIVHIFATNATDSLNHTYLDFQDEKENIYCSHLFSQDNSSREISDQAGNINRETENMLDDEFENFFSDDIDLAGVM